LWAQGDVRVFFQGSLSARPKRVSPHVKPLQESRRRSKLAILRNLLGGAFEEFVDQSLIGLGLLGGEAAKLGEETRRDANGNELFGVAGARAADTAGAAASLRSERKASGAKAPELQGEVEGRGGRLCRSPSRLRIN
jgi:hypothetical protein